MPKSDAVNLRQTPFSSRLKPRSVCTHTAPLSDMRIDATTASLPAWIGVLQGQGTYNYTYATPSNNANGFNSWKYKTTETLRITNYSAPDPPAAAGSANDAIVTVYYPDQTGQRVAHHFKKVR